jgi:hypothetical protein
VRENGIRGVLPPTDVLNSRGVERNKLTWNNFV